MNLEFAFNIVCFLPLGFLASVISREYCWLWGSLVLGLGVSLLIEISQLFTLYRATDIHDLIANALGTLLGCLCFGLLGKLTDRNRADASRNGRVQYLPLLLASLALVLTFFS